MAAQVTIRQSLELRENLYRLLSRLYDLEVDAPLLAALKGLRFPQDCGDPQLEEGYRLLEQYVQSHDQTCLDDLAVDYAGVFLAAGVAQGLAAFPYESVYTNKKRLVGQQARGSAAVAYAAKGFALGTATYKIPEDHVAVELEFMARLCREAAAEGADLAACLAEQRAFFEAHLQNWMPAFCRDVEKYAATGFYKGLAKITGGFLNLEKELFQGADSMLEEG